MDTKAFEVVRRELDLLVEQGMPLCGVTVRRNHEKLFEYAEKLAKPFPFVRADFYIDNAKVIFGELTFTPSNGFDCNRLFETNVFMGTLLDLSNIYVIK